MNMEYKSTTKERILKSVDKVTPRSRQYFILRNVSMWSLAVLSVILGGLSISSILFRAINATQTLGPKPPPLPDFFLILPYAWILLIALFGYLAYQNVRDTERGYKYELWALILGTALASCVLGMVFFAMGIGSFLDRTASRVFPFHPDLERIQEERWMNPENGFLIGEITSAVPGEDLLLTDPKQVVWKLVLSSGSTISIQETLKPGDRVGVRGKVLNDTEKIFLACSIRSLELNGRGSPPFGGPAFSRSIERKESGVRSTECEDVRPLD